MCYGLIEGEKIALIASNFGRAHHSGWYYNLKANPLCTLQFSGRIGEYIARQAEGAEREKYGQTAVSYYERHELYKARAARHSSHGFGTFKIVVKMRIS